MSPAVVAAPIVLDAGHLAAPVRHFSAPVFEPHVADTGACAVPASPFNGDGAVTHKLTIATSVNVSFSVEVPQLTHCSMAALRLVPTTPLQTPLTSVGLSVTLVMWTHSVGDGKPCSSDAPNDCMRLVRRLPLVVAAEGGALLARVVPDASVDHYMFVVEVRRRCCRVDEDVSVAALASIVLGVPCNALL
jgi:hypothetical protein